MSLASFKNPVSLPNIVGALPKDTQSWGAHLTTLQQWNQLLSDGKFIAATLASGWVNAAGSFAPAGFRVDLEGRVTLRGVLAGNTKTLPATVFTLPWAPQFHITLAAAAKNGTPVYVSAQVDIDTSGNVILEALSSGSWGASGFLSLDGISFSLAP